MGEIIGYVFWCAVTCGFGAKLLIELYNHDYK